MSCVVTKKEFFPFFLSAKRIFHLQVAENPQQKMKDDDGEREMDPLLLYDSHGAAHMKRKKTRHSHVFNKEKMDKAEVDIALFLFFWILSIVYFLMIYIAALFNPPPQIEP